MNIDTLAVIPARYASHRFPGKVIAPLAGKPLVAHTYDQVCKAKTIDKTVVATDDENVVKALEPHGIEIVMTSPDHASGTDRIAEVAKRIPANIIVNVQGDEPLIDPHTIDDTVIALRREPNASMATARHRITDRDLIKDPNIVKVVCDSGGRALYFSRWPIPFVRDNPDAPETAGAHWQHIGLYAFRRDFLIAYAQWPPSPLEKLEKLEQLRVLENGYTIVVVDTDYVSIGVDTPSDLARAEKMLIERTGN